MLYDPSPLCAHFEEESRRLLAELRAEQRRGVTGEAALLARDAAASSLVADAAVEAASPSVDEVPPTASGEAEAKQLPQEDFAAAEAATTPSSGTAAAPATSSGASSPGSAAGDVRVVTVSRNKGGGGAGLASLDALRKLARAKGVPLPRGISREDAASLIGAAATAVSAAAPAC